MVSYFSSPSKDAIELDELEIEAKNIRKNKINNILETESVLRSESEKSGIVSEYFKRLEKRNRACINKGCCKSFCKRCDQVCCFFCHGRQRFCGFLIFIFLVLIILFVLTQMGIIKGPSTYGHTP